MTQVDFARDDDRSRFAPGSGGFGGTRSTTAGSATVTLEGYPCHTYGPKGTKHYLSTGDLYRATAMGPGVTPDVSWGPMAMPSVFDAVYQLKMMALQRRLSKGSKFCTNIH